MERSTILLTIYRASDIELFSSLAKENFFAKIKVLTSEFDLEKFLIPVVGEKERIHIFLQRTESD